MSIALGLGLATAQQAQPATAKVAPASKNSAVQKSGDKKTEAAATTAKSGVKLKKDGTPDKRYKANQKLKKDGTPDKRYKENK